MGATFVKDSAGCEAVLEMAAKEYCLPAAEKIAEACMADGGLYVASLMEGTHNEPVYGRVRAANWEAHINNAKNNTMVRNLFAGAI